MPCTVFSLSVYTYLIISRKASRLCSVQYYHFSVYTYLIISRKASHFCSVQYYHSLFIHTWSSPVRPPTSALYSIITLCLYILDHLQGELPLMLCTELSLSTYALYSIITLYLCSVQYYHSLLMPCTILSLLYLYILDHLQKGLPLVNKPWHLVECAA